ncbi:MAG: DUF3592 domain-containing protein [Oscillospiraceae bacterium]|nr:DUF3592 domain-containing protein [Oscillospiraceae bacterium]
MINLFEEVQTITYTTPYDRRTAVIAIVSAAAFALLSFYFLRRAFQIQALKKRCTQRVEGVVTLLDRSAYSRRVTYNATYRYEYNGRTYESSNLIYGSQPSLLFRLHVGDTVGIWIDPDDPSSVFDELAANALRSNLAAGIMMIIVAVMLVWARFMGL